MKKRMIIMFIIAFMFIGMNTIEGIYIEGDFWSINDDTLVPSDITHNVNIGENETTSYKLKVNGTLYVNDTAYFVKEIVLYDNDKVWFGDNADYCIVYNSPEFSISSGGGGNVPQFSRFYIFGANMDNDDGFKGTYMEFVAGTGSNAVSPATITGDGGDFLIKAGDGGISGIGNAGGDGGNLAFKGGSGSFGVPVGTSGHVVIGEVTSVSTHSLDNIYDLLVVGEFEVDGITYHDNTVNMTDNDIESVQTINFTDNMQSFFGVDPRYPANWGAGNALGTIWLPVTGDENYYVGFDFAERVDFVFGDGCKMDVYLGGTGTGTPHYVRLLQGQWGGSEIEKRHYIQNYTKDEELNMKIYMNLASKSDGEFNMNTESTSVINYNTVLRLESISSVLTDSVNLTYDVSEDNLVISDADVVIADGLYGEGNNLTHLMMYAELSDNTDQTFPLTGNGYVVNFSTTDEIDGVSHVAGEHNITIDYDGVYQFIAQPQIHANPGASGYFHMWFQKDTGGGYVDIPNTNIEITLASNDESVGLLCETMHLDSGDRIRIVVSVSHTGIELDAQTPAGEPAIPSIILSVIGNR